MVIATVPFLNAVPLTWWLSHTDFHGSIIYGLPSDIAIWLEHNVVDVGLLPISEYLNGVGVGIIDGIAVTSDGAVGSVLLVSKVKVSNLETISVDHSSRSSVLLLKVILAERYKLTPTILPTRPDLDAMLVHADAALLIGDTALQSNPNPNHNVLDLGWEWKSLTGLPFVFAAWVTRTGASEKQIASYLQKAKAEGLQRLDQIVSSEAVKRHLDKSFILRYLTENICYDLTPEHLDSIRLFNQLCMKHGFLSSLRPIRLIAP